MTAGIGRIIAHPREGGRRCRNDLAGAHQVLADQEKPVARVLLRVARRGDRALLTLADLVDLVDHQDHQHADHDPDQDLDEPDAGLRRRPRLRRSLHMFLPICAVISSWCRAASPGSCQNIVTTTLRLCADRSGLAQVDHGKHSRPSPTEAGSRPAIATRRASVRRIRTARRESAAASRPHVADQPLREVRGLGAIARVVGCADRPGENSDRARGRRTRR